MPYNQEHLTRLADLKDLATTTRTQIQTLAARFDANVKASTDTDSDYAAEVVDGRVDAWANEQASLGANIRTGQIRLENLYLDSYTSLQQQMNSLCETNLNLCVMYSELKELLKQEN